MPTPFSHRNIHKQHRNAHTQNLEFREHF